MSLLNGEELGAIGVHHTATDKDGAWDAGENLKRLGDSPTKQKLRAMHAYVDDSKDALTKAAYKLPHHNVSADGKVGAANMKGVASAMGRLNGGGLDIPAGDRKGVHAHLAAHYKDAGAEVPDLKAAAELRQAITFSAPRVEYFASVSAKESGILPETLDAKERTVDVVWYSGATVPRIDPETGSEYMLRLDMEGCRFDRLNAGAAVFDSHMSGTDFRSLVAEKAGTKAQVGVVLKAWAKGPAGHATLKFDEADEDAQQLFGKIQTGTVRNLSFGTWINSMELEKDEDGKKSYVATDWEPFEISPVTVPADFNTTFLTAERPAGVTRATSPQEETQMEATPQGAGDAARVTEEQLKAAKAEAVTAERKRVAEIKAIAEPMKNHGITDVFTAKLIDSGVSVEEARGQIFAELTANSEKFKPQTAVILTRDGGETKLAQMQAALLLRSDPNFGLAKKQRHDGTATSEYLTGYGPDYQKDLLEKGREYRGFTMLEMGREVPGVGGAQHARLEPGPRGGRMPEICQGSAAHRDVRGRLRIDFGLSVDPGERGQQDGAAGLRGLSADFQAVLPDDDGGGLQTAEPRAAFGRSGTGATERSWRIPAREPEGHQSVLFAEDLRQDRCLDSQGGHQ